MSAREQRIALYKSDQQIHVYIHLFTVHFTKYRLLRLRARAPVYVCVCVCVGGGGGISIMLFYWHVASEDVLC